MFFVMRVGRVVKLLWGVQECTRRWSYRSSDKGGEQRAYSPTNSEKRSKVVRFCTTINKMCINQLKKHLIVQTAAGIFGRYDGDLWYPAL